MLVTPVPVWENVPSRFKFPLMVSAAELLMVTDPLFVVVITGFAVPGLPKVTVPLAPMVVRFKPEISFRLKVPLLVNAP